MTSKTSQEVREWIVWRVDTDGRQTHAANVMGLGFRFTSEAEARSVARDIARVIAARHAPNDARWSVEIYLVPCPDGQMARDEATWEQVVA